MSANKVVAKREAATPLTYINEILMTSWKHGGELAFAVGGIAVAGLAVRVARSQLNLTALDGRQMLFVLLPLIGMAMLFVVSKAAWRLHWRQDVALATTRSLLALNAGDRADLERNLRDQYRRRELRNASRNAQAAPLGLEAELSRADDDGWPLGKTTRRP